MDSSYFDKELQRAQQYGDLPRPIFAAAVVALVLVGGFTLAMLYLEQSLGR